MFKPGDKVLISPGTPRWAVVNETSIGGVTRFETRQYYFSILLTRTCNLEIALLNIQKY